MSVSRYATRISIALTGEIDTGITTRKNDDLADGSWVAARTGPVLTYCEDRADVTGRAAAWNSALVKARHMLPETSGHRRTNQGRVIAHVTAQPWDTWEVTGYTAAATPDGVAVLCVRTGAVTFRCHDQIAVQSMHDVWRDAAMLSRLLWRPRPSRIS
jgi:hypothetical protein